MRTHAQRIASNLTNSGRLQPKAPDMVRGTPLAEPILPAWQNYPTIMVAIGISATAAVPTTRVSIAALAFLAIISIVSVLGTR
jgi:hypothetical protein